MTRNRSACSPRGKRRGPVGAHPPCAPAAATQFAARHGNKLATKQENESRSQELQNDLPAAIHHARQKETRCGGKLPARQACSEANPEVLPKSGCEDLPPFRVRAKTISAAGHCTRLSKPAESIDNDPEAWSEPVAAKIFCHSQCARKFFR
jgi:hypothetical protein